MPAKVLITLATLFYGIAPLFADLNATHVFHPEWTPHSRLHMVWLLGTNSSIALLSLYLLWGRAQVVLSAVLGICVMLGFWIAVLFRGFYNGALTDVGGVNATVMGFEANSFAFSLVLLLLLAGLYIGSRSTRETGI